jgi:hypothetical protein
MTTWIVPERNKVRLSPFGQARARWAVGRARLLARKSPKEIRTRLESLSRGAPPARYQDVQSAHDAILTVSLRCCGEEACVPRSLAVVLLCRARGVWPTWCLGVRTRPPFGAHAWVEAEGRLVGEAVDASYFTKLFSVGVSGEPGARLSRTA